MKTQPHTEFFPTKNEALDRMHQLNRRHPNAEPLTVIEGPEDDYDVVDMQTAIEMEAPYQWNA